MSEREGQDMSDKGKPAKGPGPDPKVGPGKLSGRFSDWGKDYAPEAIEDVEEDPYDE